MESFAIIVMAKSRLSVSWLYAIQNDKLQKLVENQHERQESFV